VGIAQLPEQPSHLLRIGESLKYLARSRLVPPGRAEITRGIPLFGLADGGGRLAPGTPLERGWRYLVLTANGEPMLTIDVEGVGDQAEVGAMGIGESASRLMEGLVHAESASGAEQEEIRILESTAAGVEALWLHGANDRILRIDRDAQEAGPHPLEAFLQEVRERLEARLQAAVNSNDQGD
jgi:hypothetical protein